MLGEVRICDTARRAAELEAQGGGEVIAVADRKVDLLHLLNIGTCEKIVE